MGVLGVMMMSSSHGRKKKIMKLRTLLSLAVSRLSILKNQHQARCSVAQSDITQLLQLGHTDSALLRADTVLKEDNMLDVFAIIHSYCHLLTDRASLLQQQKGCPDELKEAVSSLIYASTRSGEMPELQHVCGLFSSMYGREFVSAATELRNCCGVNPKIVQKLSTKQPSLESRVKIIKEIAADKGIPLDFLEEEPLEKDDLKARTHNNKQSLTTGASLTRDSSFVSSVHNYKDVASAAQAAFEKAEDAAAAARAAVELTRSSHYSGGHDYGRRSFNQGKKFKRMDEDPNFENVRVYSSAEDFSSESEEEVEEINNVEFIQELKTFSASFEEKKPKIVGSWALKGDRKSTLFNNKSESETNREENDAGSDDGLIETNTSSHLVLPVYQTQQYSARTHEEIVGSSSDLESDTTEVLGNVHSDDLDKHYYSKSKIPPIENDIPHFSKESPIRQPKVGNKPVSVRTRRGMMK